MTRTARALVLSLSRTTVALSGIAVMALLARSLDMASVGTYRQAFAAYNVLLPLVLLGLPHAVIFFAARDPARAIGVLGENAFAILGLSGLPLLVGVLGGGELLARVTRNPEIEMTLLAYGPGFMALAVSYSLSSYWVSQERTWTLAAFSVLRATAAFVAVALATCFWASAVGVAAISSLSLVGTVFCGVAIVAVADRKRIVWPTIGGLSSQLQYAAPLGLSEVVGQLSSRLSVLIVAGMVTPQVFAVYSCGAIEVPLVGVVTGSAMAIVAPEIIGLVQKGEIKAGLQVWRKAVSRISVGILPSLVLLTIEADRLVSLVFSNAYADAAIPFRVFLVLLPVRVMQFSVLYMAANRGLLLLWRAAVHLVITCCLTYVCARSFGVFWSGLGVVISTYVWSVPYNLWWLSKALKSPVRCIVPVRDTCRILLVSIGAAVPAVGVKAAFQSPQVPSLLCVAFAYALATFWLLRVARVRTGIRTQLKALRLHWTR